MIGDEQIDSHLRKYWNDRLKSPIPFSKNEEGKLAELIKAKRLTLNQVCEDQNIKGTERTELLESIRSFLSSSQLKEYNIPVQLDI